MATSQLPRLWLPGQKPPRGTPVNRTHPRARELLAFWPMNEGGGSIVVDAVGQHAGNIASGVTWSADPYGLSLQFNSANAVHVPHQRRFLADLGNYFTVMARAYFTGANDQAIIDQTEADGTNKAYNLFVFGGNFIFRVNEFGASLHDASIAAPAAGWYTFTGTHDNGTTQIWIDGRAGTSASGAYLPSSASPTQMLFGLLGGGFFAWAGQISYIAIWQRALPQAEIIAQGADPYAIFDAPEERYISIAGEPPQLARPDSDVSAGTWTPSSGVDLYAMLDETTQSDADFIVSGADPNNDTFEVGLSNINDPVSSTGHILRYTYRKQSSAMGQVNLTVSLREGAGTQIATWTHTDIPATVTLAEQTLSGAEADAITSYTDLRVRGVADIP